MDKTSIKTIAENRKARHDYFILESYEAGIELTGTEVKSIRDGGLNLKDSWIAIEEGEAFIKQMHISPYEKGNIFNKDPLRERKLLMHKREIMKLLGQVKQGGLTLIPISVYFKGSRVKVQVGLCKGKKLHDKRDSIAQRDAKRTIDRAMKERNR
ncbi:MAG: SsrA-binding protein SmpB [Ruminiclostridium sp.]|nr:SsrA-binding protein SmpB [Ruminiclostridium sp.]MBQ8790360.1 SsrA-binding protein SmpB [Ruminiclostridium sp.]